MKTMMAAALAAFSMTFTASAGTDVYDFKMSAKVPYLNNGVRTYTSQALRGYMYLEYDDQTVSACYAVVKNSKTKYEHRIDFNVDVFNRLGKESKYALRSTPVISFSGAEVQSDSTDTGHEFLTSVNLCGSGSLKTVKTSGCTPCGEPATVCTRLNSASGYFTGIMDCLCPEEEDWTHTIEAFRCGDGEERSHFAPTWGSWTMSYNKKLSVD